MKLWPSSNAIGGLGWRHTLRKITKGFTTEPYRQFDCGSTLLKTCLQTCFVVSKTFICTNVPQKLVTFLIQCKMLSLTNKTVLVCKTSYYNSFNQTAK